MRVRRDSRIGKAFRFYKFLRGFTIRIGVPHSLALRVARYFYPLKPFPNMKVESGWVRDSMKAAGFPLK